MARADQTVQRHIPSGEAYVLEYNDSNEIIGVRGPLYYGDMPAMFQLLGRVEVQSKGAEWARHQVWGFPLDPKDLGF